MFYWVLHITNKLIESITIRVWIFFMAFQSLKNLTANILFQKAICGFLSSLITYVKKFFFSAFQNSL